MEEEDSVMLKQTVKCLCVYEMKAYCRTALLAIGKKIARKNTIHFPSSCILRF